MVKIFDPWAAREDRVREHIAQQRRPGKSGQAILAVLDLRPPPREYPTDAATTEEAIAEDGWWTCHATVVKALAVALGIEG